MDSKKYFNSSCKKRGRNSKTSTDGHDPIRDT